MASRRATRAISSLGTSTPIYPLPGTGATILIRLAAKAKARSSARLVILLTRTRRFCPRTSMKSGSTPNWVIVGPRLISTTWPGEPKDARVSSIMEARCWSYSSLGSKSTPMLRISDKSGRTQFSLGDSSGNIWGTAGGLVSTLGSFTGSGLRDG